MSENYIEVNKKFWNDNTPHHISSEFYNNESFLAGQSSLKDIELSLLPDLTGKKLLHLQCHFGQDAISMARLGAEVTGVDFSKPAIAQAQKMADQLNVNAQFIECDILSLDQKLDDTFDVVFSSYGTIGWLPDIKKWASIVKKFLKPGGQFCFAEFHPFVWMYDYDFSKIEYSYFNVIDIKENITGSYAAPEATHSNKVISWNHTLSDVIQSLIDCGLTLQSFKEYDYSPYNIFKEGVQSEQGYQVKNQKGNLPLVYSLVMNN